MMLLLSLILLFVPLITAKEDPSITLQLVRQKTPREIGMNIKGIKELPTDSLKPTYFADYEPPTNDSLAVFRYLDSEFYAIVQIGKKARPYNLAIDTAWADSWVMSEDCAYTTVGCWFHNKYDHTKSSSYVENGTHFNKSGLIGYYSIDTFHLEQLNVTNQTFVEMVVVPKSYAISKFDGVLGLGYSMLSPGVTPVFYNLYKQGRIKKALFSIYLNRDKSSNRGGNVILGRIEKRHILKHHNITYLPVIQTGYWEFKTDRIQLDTGKKTYPFCTSGCNAIVDTSTNAITGPKLEIDKINKLIGAKYITEGRYQIACDRINILPVITFIIGGNEFSMHGRDYVQQVSYKSFTLCLSAFKTSTDKSQSFWALGGAFLTEFYSIYNLETNEIGFVKAA